MKCKLLMALFCMPVLLFGQIDLESIEISKVWDQGDHNAFTDIIYFKGQYLITFREGSGHVPGMEDVDGTIRIIKSSDGDSWTSAALLSKSGYDLRDPKMSIMPDGRLMVTIGGSDYSQKTINGKMPHVAYSNDGINFTDPVPVEMDAEIKTDLDWIWRVTWHKGIGYSVNYQYFDQEKRIFIVTTTDGIHYEKLTELFVSGAPNEATIRFSEDDEMVVYLRRETQDREALLLKSFPPYQEYTWASLNRRTGGPNFIFLPGTQKLLIGTRIYKEPGRSTGLFLGELDGNNKLLVEFPSGGDNSYPGFLWRDGYLWMSYYSSHEGKTNIYLAKIKQSDLYLQLAD